MALGRQILDRPLDAAGNAVAGLPHAATGDAAERHDDVVAQVAAEAALRAAADALIPGTITALTGDVTASGTGAVAATLANLPQAVLLARTGALTADVPFNSRKLTGIGDGTNPQDALAFHQLGDALAAQAFTVANAAALIAINTTSLSSGIWRWVATYKAWFYLDKVSTLTADPDRVLAATTGGGFWVRDEGTGHPAYQAQMAVYFDPAGTHVPAGDNEADGSSGAPLKSMSEWRRRVKGAIWDTTAPVLHFVSDSTVLDDGIIDGVSTPNLTTFITLIGTATVRFTGTVSSYQPYSGNTRGSFVDTALTSWTASDGISTTTGGRFVRRQGTGSRPQGPLLKDMGSKTVMPGILSNWDETSSGLAPLPGEVNLSNGDTYEVVSFTQAPFIQARGNVNVRAQCFEVLTKQLGLVAPSPSPNGGVLTYILCSFGRGFSVNASMGQGCRYYSCVFTLPSAEGMGAVGQPIFDDCAWVNSVLELATYNGTITGLRNVHVASEFRVWHGSNVGSLGDWRFYDCTTPLLNVRHDSTCKIVGPITGSGNSGALVNADTSGLVYGAAVITAATSKALPYTVNGVDYAAPVVDGGSGDGIYN